MTNFLLSLVSLVSASSDMPHFATEPLVLLVEMCKLAHLEVKLAHA